MCILFYLTDKFGFFSRFICIQFCHLNLVKVPEGNIEVGL